MDVNSKLVDQIANHTNRVKQRVIHSLSENIMDVVMGKMTPAELAQKLGTESLDEVRNGGVDLADILSKEIIGKEKELLKGMIGQKEMEKFLKEATGFTKSWIKGEITQEVYISKLEASLGKNANLAVKHALEQVEKYLNKETEKALKDAEKYLMQYLNGQFSLPQCFAKLKEYGESTIQRVAFEDLKLGKTTSVLNSATPAVYAVIGYIIVRAEIKMIKDAYAEADAAHEERLRMDAETAECMRLLEEYRQNMNADVEAYLTANETLFSEVMDEINISGETEDIDRFIAANAKLVESLGGEMQFHNEEEFEAFMESDEDFEL